MANTARQSKLQRKNPPEPVRSVSIVYRLQPTYPFFLLLVVSPPGRESEHLLPLRRVTVHPALPMVHHHLVHSPR